MTMGNKRNILGYVNVGVVLSDLHIQYAALHKN